MIEEESWLDEESDFEFPASFASSLKATFGTNLQSLFIRESKVILQT
jgi:hypothetical protein